MKLLLFALSNFFIIAVAAMAADMLFTNRSRAFRFMAILCFYVIEIVWIEIAAGLAGQLTFPAASCMAGGVFAVTTAVWLKIKPRQLFFRQMLLVPVCLILGLVFGLLAGRYGFMGTHFNLDDLSYHATAVVHWYQAADIAAGTLNYHAYKPLNAELFCLWFFLPFGQDGMVFLSGLFWMVLTCSAGAVWMENFRIKRQWYGPVFFLFFCCNVILYQATWTFSAVDLAGPAMLLSALACLSTACESFQFKCRPCLLLAGLCSGFAFGTKTPFVTVFLVLAVWVFWAFKDRLPARIGNVVLFGVCAVLAGGFWYIRDMILTGNPVFPGQAGPFNGPLTREVYFGTTIAGHIINSGFDISYILEILRRHLDWPKGIFILSPAGYAAGVWLLLRNHRYRYAISLLLMISAVMMLTFLIMPFSAQNDDPNSKLAINLRFIIGPFMAGLVLFSIGLNTHGKARWLVYGLYLLCVGVSFLEVVNPIKLAAGLGALVWMIFFYVYPKRIPALVFSPAVLLPLVIGGFWGLGIMFGVQQAKTDRRLFSENMTGSNLGACWQKLDALPDGSNVTGFGAFGWCYYPWYGRHFQHTPRPFMAGLKPYEPLHLRWNKDPAGVIWWNKPVQADLTMWIEALKLNQTDYLVMQRMSGTSWHEAYTILQNSGIAQRLDEGDNWVIWKINR